MGIYRHLCSLAAAGLATAVSVKQYKLRCQLNASQGMCASSTESIAHSRAARFQPAPPGSHIVILGAGVVGVTAAYRLSERGYKVTVVERHAQAGEETSHANAGTLNFSSKTRAASPDKLFPIFKQLLTRLVLRKSVKDDVAEHRADTDNTFAPHPRARAASMVEDLDEIIPTIQREIDDMIPAIQREIDELMTSFRTLSVAPEIIRKFGFWRWGINLVTCALYRADERNDAVSKLVQFSLASLADMVSAHPELEFNFRQCGSMYVYFSKEQLDAEAAHLDQELGEVVLSPQEAVVLEPSLSSLKFAGAISRPRDRLGDCAAFTRGVADICKKRGVTFLYQHQAMGLVRDSSRVEAVALFDERTQQGFRLPCDYVIVSCGSDSSLPIADSGWSSLPILPVRGYSVSGTSSGPKQSAPIDYVLLEQPLHVISVRFGDTLRFASHAELTTALEPDMSKLQDLRDVINAIFPDAFDRDTPVVEWMGRRPMTADSLPLVCVGHLDNLILNTGHGADGWRWSHGTACAVTALIAGDPAPLDLDFMDLRRFLLH